MKRGFQTIFVVVILCMASCGRNHSNHNSDTKKAVDYVIIEPYNPNDPNNPKAPLNTPYKPNEKRFYRAVSYTVGPNGIKEFGVDGGDDVRGKEVKCRWYISGADDNVQYIIYNLKGEDQITADSPLVSSVITKYVPLASRLTSTVFLNAKYSDKIRCSYLITGDNYRK